MKGGWLLLPAMLGGLAGSLGAQDAPMVRLGRVEDAETRFGLADALVHLPALGTRVISGERGEVALEGLAPGRHLIVVERLGYESLSGEIDVPGGEPFRVLLPPARVADASEPGRIIGRVVDENGSDGIAGAEISVGDGALRVLSNQQGRFALEVAPGLIDLRIAHLGYAARSVPVVLQPNGTVEVNATMATEAIELEPIEVTVRNAWLERNGYYRRERQGFGRQFDRDDLDNLNPIWLSDVFWRVPGVRLQYGRYGETVAVSRRGVSFRGTCRLPLFVDGVRWFSDDIDGINPDWVAAMEVYVGIGTPIEYAGMNGCGAILVWTDRWAQ